MLKHPHYLKGEKERKIVEYLYNEISTLYISREVHDTLVSRYHYEKDAGGGLYNGMTSRLRDVSIAEYIRMTNYFILPCRASMEFDLNPVTYWNYHVQTWHQRGIIKVQYEDLKNNFQETVRKMAGDLKLENRLNKDIRQLQVPSANKQDIWA